LRINWIKIKISYFLREIKIYNIFTHDSDNEAHYITSRLEIIEI